jgi:hypothetical protein
MIVHCVSASEEWKFAVIVGSMTLTMFASMLDVTAQVT